VADRPTKAPFPRAERVAERVTGAAKANGLLVYPSTGCADGTDGDLVLVGPPLVADDDTLARILERLTTTLADPAFGAS
jgi:adenosylmethionine-8-amino-7-oxononanoate aminotransferase